MYDMRKISNRYTYLTPAQLFHCLRYKSLLFGTGGRWLLITCFIGLLSLFGAALYFSFSSIAAIIPDRFLGVLTGLTYITFGGVTLWSLRPVLWSKTTLTVTETAMEFVNNKGESRQIKWSDIESTHLTIFNYSLILKSGERLQIADWRTPYVENLAHLIKNLNFYYSREKLQHGIFIDSKNRLSGRGITFPINKKRLVFKARLLWGFIGMMLVGLLLIVPVIWYRLMTLESTLWIFGFLVLYFLFYTPKALRAHRLRLASSDIRLTDAALYTKINDVEERISYLDIFDAGPNRLLLETSQGSKEILLDAYQGDMILDYLLGESLRVKPFLKARHA